MATEDTREKVAGVWIIDSGATNHVTYDPEMLTDIRAPPDNCGITFGNGYRET